MPHTLVMFPGALGDFLCLWPTLQSLRQSERGRLTVIARPEVACLLPAGFDFVSIDRREIADLFASGPLSDATRALFAGYERTHSWSGYGNADLRRRLEIATGGTVSVHAFRGMTDGEHASAYFARCVGIAPADGRLEIDLAARSWAQQFWIDHFDQRRVLIIHAGSGSRAKNWDGMASIAQWWRARPSGAVLALVGPADAPETVAADVTLRLAQLDRLAAILSPPAIYLGNDSGISHLAGLAGARGAVLFGPSDPATWHPLGNGLRALRAESVCNQCEAQRFCTHQLPLERVQQAVIDSSADGP